MSFRHCEKCDADMDKPTPQEDLIDGQECPQCGHRHQQFFTLEEWLVDLWDELQALKEQPK